MQLTNNFLQGLPVENNNYLTNQIILFLKEIQSLSTPSQNFLMLRFLT
jgi:hypothetical protein